MSFSITVIFDMSIIGRWRPLVLRGSILDVEVVDAVPGAGSMPSFFEIASPPEPGILLPLCTTVLSTTNAGASECDRVSRKMTVKANAANAIVRLRVSMVNNFLLALMGLLLSSLATDCRIPT